MALCYPSIYWRYTTGRRYAARVFGVVDSILLIRTIYVIVGGLDYLGQTRAQFGKITGHISDVVAFCLYGAPMEKLFHVLKYRSAVFINVHMAIAGTTNNCICFAYGLLASKGFIAVPNILFMTTGSFTLVLYVLYNPKTHPLPDSFLSPTARVVDGGGEEEEEAISASVELSPKASLGGKQLSSLPSPEFSSMRSPLEPPHRQ